MRADAESGVVRMRPGLVILLAMAGFGVMGGGLLAPALPSLIEPFGVTEAAVGLVLGVYTFSAALSLPFTGLLIDFIGRRNMAIAFLLTDGICGLLCIAAPSFTVLLMLRFLQGIGIAGLIPVAMTVVADWYDGETRLRVMGLLSGTISLSAVVIPLVGGVLAGINWQYPFLVYGLCLLMALGYFIFIPESRSSARRGSLAEEAAGHFRGLIRSLRLPDIQRVFSHCLVLYFLLYAVVTFFPLFLARTYDLHGAAAGAALSVQGLVSALLAWQVMAMSRLARREVRVYAGFFLMAAALSSIPLWGSPAGLAVSLVLFGAGMGTLSPTIYNWTTTAAPEELRGSIVSLFNTVKYLGMTAAPVLLGWVQAGWDLSGVFWFAGLAGAAWGVAAALLSRR